MSQCDVTKKINLLSTPVRAVSWAKGRGTPLILADGFHIDQPPWFKKHVIGPEHVGVSHGNGLGDINGDGRNDVVTATGWFEAPPRPADTDEHWTWHPDYRFQNGGAGHPILVTDANGDGLNDIIVGSAHSYGLAWYEQKMEGGKRTFTEHWIETEYPAIAKRAKAEKAEIQWADETGLTPDTPIRLIKLDVEGAESRVLRGARRTLEAHQPQLLVEFNPEPIERFFDEDPRALADLLLEIFPMIDAFDPAGGALHPIDSYERLVEVMTGGPGWLDLYCRFR